MENGRLAEKAILVTGAGSGLGKATALLCAKAGGLVVCGDINEAAAGATAEQIALAGGVASPHRVDVADSDSTLEIAEFASSEYGRIDALINFAGISGAGTAVSTDPAVWSRVIAINLTGVWLMCRAVLPVMVARKSGSIVTVASVAAIVGVPASAPYSAAKAGVVGLTRSMAVDFAPDNVRANVICPGTVPTPLTIGHYLTRGDITPAAIEEGLRATHSRVPLRRHGTAEEIAALALYLASDESSFMTGAVLPIDGGVSAAGWQVGQ
jgi:NAD(P)-dependent dehydrogenase (short-subunit alcohol dehydrogenase family)